MAAVGACLFLAFVALGVKLARDVGSSTLFWPANAVLVGALLWLTPIWRCLLLVFAVFANILVNLLGADVPQVAVLFAAGNLVEVLAALCLIGRIAPAVPGRPRLGEVSDLIPLSIAVVLAPIPSAALAAFGLAKLQAGDPATVAMAWWLSSTLGFLIMLPPFLAFDGQRGPVRHIRNWPVLAGAWALNAAGLVALTALGRTLYASFFIPGLLLIALRCGVFITALSVTATCILVTAGVVEMGWLAGIQQAAAAQGLLTLQLLLALMTLPPLVVALVVDRERRARRALVDSERRLANAYGQLGDAVSSMPDAFALFDAEDRLVLCNDRYRRIYAPRGQALAPGTELRTVLEQAARQGAFSDDVACPGVWVEAEVERHRANGEPYELQLADGRYKQIKTQRTGDGGTVTVQRDISERRRLERRIEYLATHDSLTGLWNRSSFLAALDEARAAALAGGSGFAVAMLDLDQFKWINDSHGHQFGDHLLQVLAERLVQHVRRDDVVARLGGDEFALLAKGGDAASFAAAAERLLGVIERTITIDGVDLDLHASLGFTIFPEDSEDPETLIGHADAALYAAKENGGGGWRAYTPELGQRHLDVGHLTTELRRGLDNGEFDLDYQPILTQDDDRLVGLEVLLRWNHPTRGRLNAGLFIGPAERNSLVVQLTRLVLDRGLAQLRDWRDSGVVDVPLWINLSPACLRWDGLIEALKDGLARTGLPADRVVVEVTEGAFADAARAEATVGQLRALGIRVALDDFGTGYSYLGRLQSLPIDFIKIDREFTAGAVDDRRHRQIVHAMLTLAETFNLTVVAEGIESEAQLELMRRYRGALLQGFLLARPMPAPDMPGWLAGRTPAPPAAAG